MPISSIILHLRLVPNPWRARQVYAAAALMEWQGERADKVPRNIFELGLRHFLGAPGYVAAYAGWLVAAGDAPNARALFERALAAQPAPEAARALWDHYLKARSPLVLGF